MKNKYMDRLASFKKSFQNALSGFKYALKNEKNFQNELATSFLVVLAMVYFQVTRAESVALILVISGVLLAELMNTVVERVVDILKPRVHPYVKLIKDMMAAGVLLTSIMALIIGFLIFYPYVKEVF
jgi:diacylglycerol kinase